MNIALRLIIIVSLGLLSSFSFAKDAPILPVEAFASLPAASNIVISPNGKKIASIMKFKTNTFLGSIVAIYDVETKKLTPYLKTDNKKYVLYSLKWANNNQLLVNTVFPSFLWSTKIKQSNLLKLDISTGKVKPALGSKQFRKADWYPVNQSNIVDLLEGDPDHILMALRMTKKVNTSLIKLSLKNGRTKKYHSAKNHVTNWITDRKHQPRIAEFFEDTTHKVLHKPIDGKKWQTLWEYETFSNDSVYPLGFDADPSILYINAYHQGLLAVFKVNLTDPELKRELVYSDPNYDASGTLVYSRKSNSVVGIMHGGSEHVTFWDEEYSRMQRSIDHVLPDTRNYFLSMSEDEQKVIVLSTSDTDAGTYWLWDRASKNLNPLGYLYPELNPSNMIEKQLISYKARDGLEIEGYLTQPTTNVPQPTIIFPHGGPISSTGVEFNYWTQFFANRGYNVLQMNFRGSSGYGHNFMQAGLQSWGKEMQTDVEDGTRWLIEQGIADPEKICIVGSSYGGYAALMEAANNSDLYQCAISFAGVTNLRDLVLSYWRFTNNEVAKEQIGTKRKELLSRSPVSRAEEINIPVLLVHGSKDRSVKASHSKKMYKELKAAGKEVTFLEQENGDHFLSNEIHRIELFKEMDRFLSKHLH